MVSLTKIFSPWVTTVFAALAALLTLVIAPSIVSASVPPMLVVVMTPPVLTALPPITFLIDSAEPNSWPPFTASVEPVAMLPPRTPITFLLPALMPVVVILGPPSMVRPVLLNTLLPALTLVTSRASTVAIVISLPVPVLLSVRITLIFLPSTNLTVSLVLTAFTPPVLAATLNV